MATIPTYDEWMKTTKLGVMSPRSSEFEAIDRALRKFEADRNGPALQALHTAFNAWKRTKPDWKSSERNKGQILERLNEAIRERLGPLGSGPVDPIAMAALEEARRTAIRRLFEGKHVAFKYGATTVEAKNSMQQLLRDANAVTGGGASRAIRGGVASIPSPVSLPTAPESFRPVTAALDAMIGKFFDEAATAVVRPLIIRSFGGDVVASMVPVLGLFKNASEVIYSWGVLGKKKYDEVTTKGHRAWIGEKGSDAAAAFVALESLLDDATKHAAIGAVRTTTTFAAKSALALADGGAVSGPVLSVADAIARMTHQLWKLGTEYRETKRANEILAASVARPQLLGLDLVSVYPLLGCYLLTCSSLSDVVNMANVQFGASMWKEDIEWMKKTHIDPVREKARGFIDASIFHVPGLTPMVKAGTFDTAMWAKKTVLG